ncbi:transposase, partial [Edwardsiella ictaluri]
MADNSMTFSNTLMQLGGEDFLRALTEFMLNRIMEDNVTQRINAEPHERSDERETYRNGYRDRQYNTRLGMLDLRISKLREGTYLRRRSGRCSLPAGSAAGEGSVQCGDLILTTAKS